MHRKAEQKHIFFELLPFMSYCLHLQNQEEQRANDDNRNKVKMTFRMKR